MQIRFRSKIRVPGSFGIAVVGLLVFLVLPVAGQKTRNPENDSSTVNPGSIKSTPAYAEIVLRRTEFEAELESLLLDYTDDFPKVKELKFALTRTKAGTDRLIAIPANAAGKASHALGKLMVRKVEAEIDLWKLEQSYADNHPEVRRAKRKVEIYEKAIKEILG